MHIIPEGMSCFLQVDFNHTFTCNLVCKRKTDSLQSDTQLYRRFQHHGQSHVVLLTFSMDRLQLLSPLWLNLAHLTRTGGIDTE